VTNIESSAQAAEALKPVAGNLAFTIFALGIVGTGLLAVPALAGSAAYAVGEARKWPVGLARRPLQAKAFYATVALATLIGALINFSLINPIKALYWSAVLNGIVAVPVMAMMMLISVNPTIMGKFDRRRDAHHGLDGDGRAGGRGAGNGHHLDRVREALPRNRARITFPPHRRNQEHIRRRAPSRGNTTVLTSSPEP
jgi:Mn2+/Fe2+ NRAMP family transporter